MTIKKVLIYSLIGFIVFALIIGGIIFFVMNGKSKESNSGDKPKEVFEYSLEELYTNIKDSNSILKTSISIEYTDKKLLEVFDKNKSKITNDILEFFRSKTLEELSGKDGQQSARNSILVIVKKTINSDAVSNIYFTEFIIQ